VTLFAWTKELIRFVLELVQGDLSTRVGLQMRIEAIVAPHAALASCVCPDTRTEFLKVHTYPVEADAASAVWTFDFWQCGH
jgi:hypothetical protein